MLVFAFSVPIGAALTSSTIFLAATTLGRPPTRFIAIVAITAIACGVMLPADAFGSRWRVPEAWRQLGRIGFSAAFGAILGAGFLTAPASIGLPVLYAWSLTAPTWHDAIVVALVFGFARALPSVVVAFTDSAPRPHVFKTLQLLESVADKMTLIEVAVLALIGVTFFR